MALASLRDFPIVARLRFFRFSFFEAIDALQAFFEAEQSGIAGLMTAQPCLNAAVMLYGAQAVGADGEPHTRVKVIAIEGDRLQVGKKSPFGLVVSVAHIVAACDFFLRDDAMARHDYLLGYLLLALLREL